MTRSQTQPIWRSPAEIVALGFQRSRVVMMNEAHHGLKRSIRTRRIGQSILPTAHACGVRHLAMEALYPAFAEICNETRQASADEYGYLAQPEMTALIQSALDLGWTLTPYEADDHGWFVTDQAGDAEQRQEQMLSLAFSNWREEQQALNLLSALKSMPAETKLLVWCGNGHNAKVAIEQWIPMAGQFARLSHIEPFAIDQIRTIRFDRGQVNVDVDWVAQYGDDLRQLGGTAGFLREDGPAGLDVFTADAFLLSLDNELE